jgi:hypothetical protein
MAVRSTLIRSVNGTRTTVTLAIATLFGMVGLSSSEAARQQWEDGPAASVLVESDASHDGEVIVGDGGFDPRPGSEERILGGGGHSEYEAYAFSGDGCCSSCTGAGCDQCCPSALIDRPQAHRNGH